MQRKGFFNTTQLPVSQAPVSILPKCGLCKLKQVCNSPMIPVTGKGKKKILIVGEYPRDDEDHSGKNFKGEGGRLLEHVLHLNKVDMHRDCWMTHALICRPPRGRLDQKNEKKIEYCRPLLLKAIQTHKPELVLCLGDIAIKSLLRHYWTSTKGSLTTLYKWNGSLIPLQEKNMWIACSFDPYLVSVEKDPSIGFAFKRHIEKAIKTHRKKNRPWKTLPKYDEQVSVLFDTEKAVKEIQKFHKSPYIAFDYETNTTDPQNKGARIYCCSISDGHRTISYPWTSKTANATKQLLKSSIPKIGQNIKFEEEWTRSLFGPVVNWYWDAMLAAHVLDSRGGVTGLKLQSFARLGGRNYDDHIKPFLESSKANKINRVHLIDKYKLLLYCGLDSLYTIIIALKQMKEYKYPIPGE